MPESIGFAGGIARRHVLGLFGAGSVAVLTGCRSAVDEGPAGAGGTPTRGGTLHIAQVPDVIPSGLFGQNFPNSGVGRLVFNTLTEYDHKTLEPKPALAKSWTIEEGGRSVTLQLRDDVKFHSGRPFTAEDVIFSITNLQNPARASQLRSTASVITDMSATGAHEVRLRLKHSVSNLFDLFELMFIVDRESLPDMLSGKRLIGTGPFMWKEWRAGSSVTLERNPSYWVPDRPYLDGVEIRIIPQAQSVLASLQSRQTQLALGLAPKDVARLRQDKAFKTVSADTNDAVYYVGCNVKVPPFDRREVRQAIAYAVDRERILTDVFAGLGTVTSIPWPATSPAFDQAAKDHYRYDLGRAKQMLATAGVTNAKVQLAVNSGSPSAVAMAQIVQFDLQQIGLTVETVAFDAAQFIKKLAAGDLPGLWVTVHGFAQLHPATLATSAFPFSAAKNASNFTSPEYTAAVQAAWQASDETAAKKAYGDITKVLLDEQFVIDSVIAPPNFVHVAGLNDLWWNMFSFLNLDNAYLG